MVRSATKNRASSQKSEKAHVAATLLIEWGDELNDRNSTSILERCFRWANSEVLQIFIKAINDIRHSLSWEMVARLFHLGVRLLKNLELTPHENCIHGQQWELFMAFVDFLRDELSLWIEEQGGWVSSFHCC